MALALTARMVPRLVMMAKRAAMAALVAMLALAVQVAVLQA